MRRLLILAFAAALAATTCHPVAARAQPTAAPSPEAMAAARDLFTLIFDHAIGQLNTQAVANAWPPVERALRSQNPNLDSAALAALREEFERIRLVRLHEATKDLPLIYVRHLSIEEMRDLAAFYRTPTGAKMLQILPQVMAEGFGAMLPRMRAVSDDAQEAFLKLLNERGLLRRPQ